MSEPESDDTPIANKRRRLFWIILGIVAGFVVAAGIGILLAVNLTHNWVTTTTTTTSTVATTINSK